MIYFRGELQRAKEKYVRLIFNAVPGFSMRANGNYINYSSE
jgi:hypothetical protein